MSEKTFKQLTAQLRTLADDSERLNIYDCRDLATDSLRAIADKLGAAHFKVGADALQGRRREVSEAKNRCGNCRRFVPDPERPGTGWCDECPVALTEDCVCHPYVGRPKTKEKEDAK